MRRNIQKAVLREADGRPLPAVFHYSSAPFQRPRRAGAQCRREMAAMQTNNLNVTTKQFLKDLAYTAGAALLTGGTVSLVAALVILVLAR
jgi:hypothetical protein